MFVAICLTGLIRLRRGRIILLDITSTNIWILRILFRKKNMVPKPCGL